MYRMAMTIDDKRIKLSRCCLCMRAQISDRVICETGLSERDSCESFVAVSNVAERVNELFHKLPNGYGDDDLNV